MSDRVQAIIDFFSEMAVLSKNYTTFYVWEEAPIFIGTIKIYYN